MKNKEEKPKKQHVKNLREEFKKFISKGNVVDLAAALVIGTAFNKIVSQFVTSFINPLVSLFTGKINMDDWKYIITPASVDENGNELAEVAITYGTFITVIIDFIVTALSVFLVYKIYKYLKKEFDEEKEKIRAEIFKEEVEKEKAEKLAAEKKAAEEAEKAKLIEEAERAEKEDEKRRRIHEEELLSEICELLRSEREKTN